MENASKEEIRRELSDMGSSLPAGEKGFPFQVPEGYFDQLPHSVQDRLAARRNSVASWLPMLTPRRLQLAVASVALLAVLAIGLFLIQKETGHGLLFATEEEESEFFFSMYAELDPFALYDLVLETDMTADELYFGLGELQSDPDEEAFMEFLYENFQAFEPGTEDYIFP